MTASRREEQLRNAPATMTVVTDAAIRDVSGARRSTDLMRHVPGVNVSQTSARDVNVTPRAATGTLSDSLLVLLDGRSIYQDFFGAVLWDFLPIESEEIKQIEVIRGPASAVWGANAMSGVVNVISKTPREMQGTSVGIRFGQFDRTPVGEPFDGGGLFSVDVTHAAAASDRFAYKISAGFLTQEAFLRPERHDSRAPTRPIRPSPTGARRSPGWTPASITTWPTATVPGSRRRHRGNRGHHPHGSGPARHPARLDVQVWPHRVYGRPAEAAGIRQRARREARAVLLKSDSRAGPRLELREPGVRRRVRRTCISCGERHVVSYGGNYRHNNFDLSTRAAWHAPRTREVRTSQDEIVLSDRFRWIVGVRLDAFDVLQSGRSRRARRC